MALKLSVRWKFLLILLAFSLLPFIAIMAITQINTEEMGDIISDNVTDYMTRLVKEEMEEAAQTIARIISGDKLATEYMVMVLRHEAERALERNPPPDAKVFFAPDFVDPATAPPDLSTDDRYYFPSDSNEKILVPVSFQYPVFLVPGQVGADYAGTEPTPEIAAAAAKLTAAFPVLKSFYQSNCDELFRLYVSLEMGLHMSYPGHGAYPANYDPRERSWYKAALAMDNDGINWTIPVVDVTTGLPTFTASRVIRNADGTLAGVVGVDIFPDRGEEEMWKPRLWADDLRYLMVAREVNPATGDFGFVILDQQDYQQHMKTWEEEFRHEWLVSEDKVAFTAMAAKLKKGKSGALEMHYKGREAIWAFAPMGGDINVILIVPKTSTMVVKNRIQGHVGDLIMKFIRINSLLAFLILLAVTVVAVIGAKATTRPLVLFADAARRLSRGDFSVHMKEYYGDERDILVRTFNQLGPRLKENLDLQQSLELAQEVQLNLLPKESPNIPGYDISGVSFYCDATGGDYFDFFRVEGQDRSFYAVVVGDVSGHGLPSALLMATARALLRGMSVLPTDSAHRLTLVNRLLSEDLGETGRFITLLSLEIDTENNVLRWVRAGHDPAIVYDPATDSFTEFTLGGMPMGVLETNAYEQEEMQARPGQILLMGTDGIWESRDEKGEMFGKARVLDCIRRLKDQSARAIQDAVLAELGIFRHNARQEDDITLVVIKKL